MLNMRRALYGLLASTCLTVPALATAVPPAPQPVVSSLALFRANNYASAQEAVIAGARFTYYPTGCVDDGVHCVHDGAGHSYILRTSPVPPAGTATLGGVYAHTPIANQFLTGVGTNGVFSAGACGTACGADTGTSGHKVPYLDGSPNTWSGANNFTKDTTVYGTGVGKGLNGAIDARMFSSDGVTVDTATLQAALDYAAANHIPRVNLGASQSALITALNIPDFVTLNLGGVPAIKLAVLRDYRLSTGIQGVLQYSSLGTCITMGTGSAIESGTVMRGDGAYPPTTTNPTTTRDGINVQGAMAGTALCKTNPSAVARNISFLGFDQGIIESSTQCKLIDVTTDSRKGVLYSNAESCQADRLSISSQLTKGLDLSSGIVWLANDGSNQYEFTWDVNSATQFSFVNGDTFTVVPPSGAAQSAAGGWIISNAAVRANGVKGCTRVSGCPGGTLTGSNVTGTTLSATWTNTADGSGNYYLTVTPGTTGPLSNGENVASASCMPVGEKILTISDTQGRIYLTAAPTCSAGPQNVTFTDDAWTSGGTGFVNPSSRSGDGLAILNSSGIKVDQSIMFSHDVEIHYGDGARNNHVKGCTSGENGTSLDDGKIGILIDGNHAGNDADSNITEDCNAGQHATKSIVINSDSTKRNMFTDIWAAPGTGHSGATAIEINSGAAQFLNTSTGGVLADVFIADGMTYHVVYIDSSNQGSAYTVGDVLTTTGGTCTQQAQFTVDGVTGSGAIKTGPSGGHQSRPFICTVYPSNPISLTGGTGTGANLVTDGFVASTVSMESTTGSGVNSNLYLQTVPGTAYQGVNNRFSNAKTGNYAPTMNIGTLYVAGSSVLPPAMIPAPAPASLGGVNSIAAVTHKWLDSITTLGVPHASQPACTDLSDAGAGCSGVAAVNPNLFVNSAFDVWQENTSYTPSSGTDTWVADRWKVSRGGSANYTASRVAGFNNAQYALRMQRNNGTSDTSVLNVSQQIFTTVATSLGGKSVTVSCDVRTGADFSMTDLNVNIITGTGTDEALTLIGGTFPTGTATAVSTTQALSPGTTQRVTWPAVAVPAGTTELAVKFKSNNPSGTAGANDYFDLTNCKVEVGAVATTYSHPTFADSLAAALFTYRKSFTYATVPAQAVGINTGELVFAGGKVTTGTEIGDVQFGTPMRVAPTVTFYNPASANGNCRNETAGADGNAGAATVAISEKNIALTCAGSGAGAVGDRYGIHWTADARL